MTRVVGFKDLNDAARRRARAGGRGTLRPLAKRALELLGWLTAFLLFLYAGHAAVAATSTATPRQTAGGQTDFAALLDRLKGDDVREAARAGDALAKEGRAAVAPLSEFVKREKGEARLRGALVLSRVEPENEAAIAALVSLASKSYLLHNSATGGRGRRAALELAETGAGVRELTKLLKHWDSWIRRAAAFAFDERTETLDRAPPKVRAAVVEAIPALVEALRDKDEMVRGWAQESLVQIGAGAVPALEAAARGDDRKLRPAAAETLEQIKGN